MTNYEKWRFYLKNITSPDSYIDFGWYYLIGACLQRRVWLYDEDFPLYPNQYLCLVGPPGLGKGLVLGPIARILKFHKHDKGQLIKTSIGQELPPLFPVGADSTTFEQLLAEVGDSSRRIVTPDQKTYIHCSFAFVLEELASLFKHKTADVIKFLQSAFDCKDYDYKTKHQGKDVLRNLCFSFIAGTQVDFLKEAGEARIFGQGFASRTLFLFEQKTRFDAFHISEITEEQKIAYRQILDWVKKLSTVYGKVTYDKEAYKFLEEWYMQEFVPARNAAPAKLQDYYSRKKVIMLKLAIAIHFSESLEMVVPVGPFKSAIELLRPVEEKMAVGFGMSGRNQLHGIARNICNFIQQAGSEGRAESEIYLEFGADCNIEELKQCLEELKITHNLKRKLKHPNNYYIE